MKGEVIKSVYLEAESPKRAFYVLTLRRITDGYLVCKESGAEGKVLHREAWFRETLIEAEKLFERKRLQKTKTSRRSPRKYRPAVPRERGVKQPVLFEFLQDQNCRIT